MKTHPSQRKFGFPVAIVASAHAILFLGFRIPHPVATTPKQIQPATKTDTIEIFEPPVVDVTRQENANATAKASGEPTPTTDDRPSVIQDPTSIPIPVESQAFRSVAGPINIIPIHAGPPGGPTGIPSIASLDFVPHALSRVSPIYPASMKSGGITGSATVMFTVDESGRVIDASVIHATRSEFADPALRAVFHWRFEPGKRHGRPTAFRMSIPLNFVLDN